MNTIYCVFCFFVLSLIKPQNEIKSTKKITFFYLFYKSLKNKNFYRYFFLNSSNRLSLFLDKVLAQNWLIFGVTRVLPRVSNIKSAVSTNRIHRIGITHFSLPLV